MNSSKLYKVVIKKKYKSVEPNITIEEAKAVVKRLVEACKLTLAEINGIDESELTHAENRISMHTKQALASVRKEMME